jgi:hypothetical protein
MTLHLIFSVYYDEHRLHNSTLQLADLLAHHIPKSLVAIPDLLQTAAQHLHKDPTPTPNLQISDYPSATAYEHLVTCQNGTYLQTLFTRLCRTLASTDPHTGHPKYHPSLPVGVLGLSEGCKATIAVGKNDETRKDVRGWFFVDPLLEFLDPMDFENYSIDTPFAIVYSSSANTMHVGAFQEMMRDMKKGVPGEEKPAAVGGRLTMVQDAYPNFVGSQTNWENPEVKVKVMGVVREIAEFFEKTLK